MTDYWNGGTIAYSSGEWRNNRLKKSHGLHVMAYGFTAKWNLFTWAKLKYWFHRLLICENRLLALRFIIRRTIRRIRIKIMRYEQFHLD
ncbi:hypothetical protein KAR91_78015 [Candidatus Pacearchaeota archaeon]|nr:hypothetical protein [Candidatus Pacearchaeota archaeon]